MPFHESLYPALAFSLATVSSKRPIVQEPWPTGVRRSELSDWSTIILYSVILVFCFGDSTIPVY